MEFNIQYFRNKFSALPDEAVGDGEKNKDCALYHCGVTSISRYEMTEEANALAEIFLPLFPINQQSVEPGNIWRVNDGTLSCNDVLNKELRKLTPRRRILFALDVVEQIQINRKCSAEEQIHSALLSFQTRDY